MHDFSCTDSRLMSFNIKTMCRFFHNPRLGSNTVIRALWHFLIFQILEQQNVANQFLLLNTTLGQALDRSSLPDISDEVREQVRRSDGWSISFILVFNVVVGVFWCPFMPFWTVVRITIGRNQECT